MKQTEKQLHSLIYIHNDLTFKIISIALPGVKDNHELRGVIPRSCEHIFNHIEQSTNQQYLVYVSYLQIYQVGKTTLFTNFRQELTMTKNMSPI